MTAEAKILAHSRGPSGQEVVTFQLRYWRAIHAELMTHRVFSRNASSSRAIPIQKMIQAVLDDPAMPVCWGKNIPGMQAREEVDTDTRGYAKARWLAARDRAIEQAELLESLGLHKQLVNRVLEPWMHISVVLTSTIEGLANFWHLRDRPDAQPEIQELARIMRSNYNGSIPRLLALGQWHLPYITAEEESSGLDRDMLRRVSAARCCRVSYNKHDGALASIKEDLALCERLIGQKPLHASPFEHQATPDQRAPTPVFPDGGHWCYPHLHGNLPGWIQFRKTLDGEFLTELPVREGGL